ncbi:hypothetical protein [Vallitalea guaymasensis]|uniref:hypothetical protein n=1 Tax=Vallitalea guaymasensis TaxID=1185412 RepID=UPI002353026B|nr:hypothetical protein [Vallitalea guaymasensis]
MKIRILKLISLLTLMVIVCNQSIKVNASTDDRDMDRYAPDAIIAPKSNPVTTIVYEYDMIKEVKNEDEIDEMILDKMKSKDINSNIFKLYNNSIVDSKMLAKSYISMLSEDAKRDYFAKCTITHKINFHAYLPSMNKTVAYIDFNWEWDIQPDWRRTDMIGFGWDAIMHKAVSDSEKHYIKYYKGLYAGEYASMVEQQFTQYEGNCLSDKIDMQNSRMEWAKEGRGEFKLDAAGEVINLGVSYKYGHQRLSISSSPSISYPFGIGFTIKHVQDTIKSELAVSHLY